MYFIGLSSTLSVSPLLYRFGLYSIGLACGLYSIGLACTLTLCLYSIGLCRVLCAGFVGSVLSFSLASLALPGGFWFVWLVLFLFYRYSVSLSSTLSVSPVL